MDVSSINECPDCASTNIIHNKSRDQVICKDCGLIFEILIPDEEEKYARVSKTLPKVSKTKPGKGKKEKPAKKKSKKKSRRIKKTVTKKSKPKKRR